MENPFFFCYMYLQRYLNFSLNFLLFVLLTVMGNRSPILHVITMKVLGDITNLPILPPPHTHTQKCLYIFPSPLREAHGSSSSYGTPPFLGGGGGWGEDCLFHMFTLLILLLLLSGPLCSPCWPINPRCLFTFMHVGQCNFYSQRHF